MAALKGYATSDRALAIAPPAIELVGDTPSLRKGRNQVRVLPLLNPYTSNYNVTADGQRFLFKVPAHDVTSTPIHLLSNWPNAKRGS